MDLRVHLLLSSFLIFASVFSFVNPQSSQPVHQHPHPTNTHTCTHRGCLLLMLHPSACELPGELGKRTLIAGLAQGPGSISHKLQVIPVVSVSVVHHSPMPLSLQAIFIKSRLLVPSVFKPLL
jgi:hypothetical protein